MGEPRAPARGLSAATAAERLAADGPNELPRPARPGVGRRALRALVEPLSLVLLGAAIATGLVLDQVAEALAILVIVVLNTSISVHQERRADVAVDRLAELTAPTARVRRDGTMREIAARELVVGDVVELAAGDRVPADLLLHTASSLAVDESTLTGESLPVDRVEGEAARAGTMVVRGMGDGVVSAIGASTSLGRIATALGDSAPPPLVRELRRVAFRMSVIAVALGGLLVPIALVRDPDGSIADAVIAGVAMAIATIPEGLPAVVTTLLALGAHRMAEGGTIVRRLPAIETMGAVTVLCSDKTGTLTTGQLSVVDTRAVVEDGALWQAALRCTGPPGSDAVDDAIRRGAADAGATPSGWVTRTVVPFDPVSRSMTTVVCGTGGAVVTVKGAPEVVLSRCGTSATVDALAAEAASLMARGCRVLAVAERRGDDIDGMLEPIGLLAFADPVRASARDAVAACRRAGLRIVMVTGDHPVTASAVADALGLDAEPVVTGDGDAPVDPDRLRAASVVARVTPETKVALVRAHQAGGAIVGMTGDGVNDAPALRAADVGIAITGSGGTDVAREAADVVVTGGDLAMIVGAVRTGRQVFRNLTVVIGYLVTGNMSEVLTVAAAIVVLPELAVPLVPVQLLWLNLVTDGLPAVALGLDTSTRDPLRESARPPASPLLPAARIATLVGRGAILAVAVVATGLLARWWGWTSDVVRSQLLLSLICCHVVHAYTARAFGWTFERGWARNRSLLAAVGASMAIQVPVFATSVGRDVFALGAIPPVGWVMAAGVAVASAVTIDVTRFAARRRPAPG